MRMRKLFSVALAATAFLFASGCCETDCYGVRYNPCDPCAPAATAVYLPPAPAPVAVTDCPPPRPPKQKTVRHPRRGCLQPAMHYYFAGDPCLGNPPLLIQVADVADAAVLAAPALTVDCPPAPPPRVKRQRPAKAVDCPPPPPVRVRPVPPPRTKVRGRTRTIIPVVNNSLSADCEAARAGTVLVAPPPPAPLATMRSRPVFTTDDVEAATIEDIPSPVTEKPVRRDRKERRERKADMLGNNPPLLSDSPDLPPATATADRRGVPGLEPVPHQSPRDQEVGRGPEAVRRAAGLAGPLMTEPPEVPAPGTGEVAGRTDRMDRPAEAVTASGFEPGALPGCAPAAPVAGCPPAGHLPGCPGPAPSPCGPGLPAGNCPQPFAPLCQPSDSMSGCFSLSDDQLISGPPVLTPNAMTPLPLAPAAPLPALPVPGQTPAPAAPRATVTPPVGVAPLAPPPELLDAPGKYGALSPAAASDGVAELQREEPRLSMPAPIGGNIPPVVPAQEIESALDAMLSGGV